MKKLLALSALGVSLGAASIALAGNVEQSAYAPENQGVTGGAYISGSIGIGGMDTPKLNAGNHGITSASSKLRDGVSYRAAVGYLFPVAPKLLVGAELGYTGYPKNKYIASNGSITDNLNYNGHLFDLLGVAKYYFGSNFNVFAKAGGAYVYQKVTASNKIGGVSFKKDKILPEVAAGVGYDFTPAVGVDVTYSHVFGDKPSFFKGNDKLSKVASVNTLLAGVTYKFST